jgi:Restriction endonuclease S subunits
VGKWEMVKLGDIATYINGAPFRPDQWTDTGLPIIRIQNLNNSDAPFNYYDKNLGNKYVVNNGDVLVSWSASLGVFKWNRGKAYLNQHIFKVVFNKKIEIDKDYYIYTIGRMLNEMRKQTHGSTMKHITKGDFDNMLFPFPPLETQKQIAKTLDTAAELLAMRKQQLTELDNLIKSVFYDMFGDPDNNPYGWNINLLEDTADIVSGITKGRKISEIDLVPIPYMRVANVQDGHLNLNEIKELYVANYEIEKYKLVNGDLLMTEGGDPDKLGRCAIWKEEIPVCIHQNHIFRVRFNQKLVLPEYASFLIGSFYGKKYFLKAAKQTTGIATINSKQLRNLPLLVPDINLQNQFAQIVTKIEEQKALVKKAIDETQYLFDSLMSGYFD